MRGHLPRRGLLTSCIFLSSVGLVSVCAGSPFAWNPNGVPVCTADGAQFGAAVVPDLSGRAVVSWIDTRNGVPQVYGLRLDKESGGPYSGWPAGGSLLGAGECGPLRMAPDDRSGAYIASDTRTQYGYPTFSHLRALNCPTSGAAESGSLAPSAAAPADVEAPEKPGRPPWIVRGRHQPSMTPDGAGNVLLVSLEIAHNTTANTIAYSVILERVPLCGSAAPPWSATLATDTIPFEGAPAVCSDGAGGAIATWLGTVNNPGIKVSRIAADGTPSSGWTPGGLTIGGASLDPQAPGIAPDGAGGAFIVWQDRRGGLEQTYVQRVNGNGTAVEGWPRDGLALSPDVTFSANAIDGFGGSVSSVCVVSDGASGAFGEPTSAVVVWVDHRAEDGSSDIYAQRVLEDGSVAAGWPRDGLAISQTHGHHGAPVAVTDGSGGAYIVWQASGGDGWDIYAQHVNAASGFAVEWEVNGLPVCVELGDQTDPVISTDGAGGAYVVWSDSRAGNPDVYAASLRQDAVTGVLVSTVRADAEPDRVQLIWALADPPSSASVQRRTATGRWEGLGVVRPDGVGQVRFEDRRVAPGRRYAYRLRVARGGVDDFSAETWVEIPDRSVLALAGLRPNPASVSLTVSLSLSAAEPASLEFLDVTGRRVMKRDLGTLSAGHHLINLGSSHALRPGVYYLRLTQHGRSVTARAVISE